MIMTTGQPAALPRPGERRLDASPRAETAAPRPPDRDADAFARVLRRKSGDDDESRSDDGGDAQDAPAPPITPDAPVPAPALRAVVALSASPLLAAAELPPAVVAAASRSALNGEAPASIATALRGEAPQAFEVSLQAAPGVDVSLRATRDAVAPTTSAQAPSWQLHVASTSLGRAALARHASRLDERLRARGVVPCHVRIEDTEDEPS